MSNVGDNLMHIYVLHLIKMLYFYEMDHFIMDTFHIFMYLMQLMKTSPVI